MFEKVFHDKKFLNTERKKMSCPIKKMKKKPVLLKNKAGNCQHCLIRTKL